MEQLYGVPKDLRNFQIIQRIEKEPNCSFGLNPQPISCCLRWPTGGLDVMSARSLRSLICQLNEQGTTIFLTTHNVQKISQRCHRIAIIVGGESLKKSAQEDFMVEIAIENPDPSDLLRLIKEIDGVKK